MVTAPHKMVGLERMSEYGGFTVLHGPFKEGGEVYWGIPFKARCLLPVSQSVSQHRSVGVGLVL